MIQKKKSGAIFLRTNYRIGPVVLAITNTLEENKGPLRPSLDGDRLDRSVSDCRDAERILRDFEVPHGDAPHLELAVERGIPNPRPHTPLLFTHRAGWDVYGARQGWTAFKAIPYGSGRILRSVEVAPDGGAAVLRISPEDDRPGFPLAYTLSELLVLLLSRLSGALLVHSACVEIDGKAWLFPGSSGSGKSTMAGLWDRSGRGEVLGDESHLLWTNPEGRLVVSGTPWPGSSRLYSSRTAPLDRVFFLRHGRKNALRREEETEGMLALMSHSFLPSWDAAAMETVTDLSARVAQTVPLCELSFAPDAAVVEYLLSPLHGL